MPSDHLGLIIRDSQCKLIIFYKNKDFLQLLILHIHYNIIMNSLCIIFLDV